MARTYPSYNVEQEVLDFFAKTSATRAACNSRATALVGGTATLVPIQGESSYTVYAGPNAEFVVQFRYKSLALSPETVELARKIYGDQVPAVTLHGEIGVDDVGADKEALCVYVMPRLKGITELDHLLAHGQPQDAPEVCARRKTFVLDAARFFALAWKSPQRLSDVESELLQQKYSTDLKALPGALPERFHPAIQRCVEALPSIMALPSVLTHKDFGYANAMVDPETGHLLGVLDWSEASIEPFGINLFTAQNSMSHFHLRDGRQRYVDYDELYGAFWETLERECGGWDCDVEDAIQSAMLLGFLRSHGFTPRLANMPKPRPISDDESGAYMMLHLDSFITNPETKVTG